MKKIIVITAAVLAVAACGRKKTPVPAPTVTNQVSTPSASAPYKPYTPPPSEPTILGPVDILIEMSLIAGNWIKARTETDLVSIYVTFKANGDLIISKTFYEFDGSLLTPLEETTLEVYSYKLLPGKRIQITKLEKYEPTNDVRILSYSVKNNELKLDGYNDKTIFPLPLTVKKIKEFK